MIINRIHLENFKCFIDCDIEINQLNFLVGINSVGKSSIIQSILLPLQSVHDTDIELNGPLINLGDHNDILNIEAADDSIRINIQTNDESC
ncbi:AAA family ATPase, partial [Salmonella enterica]|nr:AAA family ATPase [Salmonella enterica]